MNTEDRFDDLIRERLRAAAPSEAPARVLEGTMTRISDTPQRGRGWFGGTAGRLLAAAAVLLIAILAGSQLARILDRPVGAGESPSPSAEESPRPSAVPTASPPSSAASSASEPTATDSPGAADALILRVTAGGGGPTSPIDQLPWVSLMADGTLVWQTLPPGPETPLLVTRRLTQEGLAQMRDRIFGSGLLDASGTYELGPLPGAEPPGRGVMVFTFTTGASEGEAVVTSVQWLGDEEEQTYYQPSPERERLDALARALRDPESMMDDGAWEGPAEPYEAAEYQLVLMPQRDVPPFGNPDVDDLPLAFDGPIEEFGESVGSPGEVLTRCGVITREEAAGVVRVFDAGDFGEVGLDRPTAGGLDWAEGNGIVDVVLLPLMPDGLPECEDQ
jgi:hypothetical protein